MMPWASDGVADEQALFERSTVVRADCADGEHLVATPDEEHGLALGVPQQHGSVGDRRKLYGLREVRSAHLCRLVAHMTFPMLRAWRGILMRGRAGGERTVIAGESSTLAGRSPRCRLNDPSPLLV
jgi:hypothetical protein